MPTNGTKPHNRLLGFKNRSAFSAPSRGVLPALVCIILLSVSIPIAGATVDNESSMDMQWGGHLRAIGTATWMHDQSIYQFTDTGVYGDGQAELRVKNELFLGTLWTLETHYEAVAIGGDTRKNNRALIGMVSGSLADPLIASSEMSDAHRFFNLTHTLVSEDNTVVYHRLDRLNLTYTPSWGSLRLGRQALTWGNGMVFNPMDLFNPFAPTSVQRDYKIGDDMILGQIYFDRNDGQVLYVPRRDTTSGDLRDSQSSYAGKLHFVLDELETDVMVARHYGDDIFAWGATGYMGEATWRLNAVYTQVSQTYSQDDFLQIVANVDYAWVWGGKNVYGLAEVYYNGVGANDDYIRSLESPYISSRLSRGDLFTLGRCYLAGLLQIELHPLVRNHWTMIANLEDLSGLVQPQLLWDVAANLQLILGAQWHWGAEDTEYGGFKASVAGRTVKITPNDQIYLWLTYSF